MIMQLVFQKFQLLNSSIQFLEEKLSTDRTSSSLPLPLMIPFDLLIKNLSESNEIRNI